MEFSPNDEHLIARSSAVQFQYMPAALGHEWLLRFDLDSPSKSRMRTVEELIDAETDALEHPISIQDAFGTEFHLVNKIPNYANDYLKNASYLHDGVAVVSPTRDAVRLHPSATFGFAFSNFVQPNSHG
jgi:hypothetical protein